MLGKYGHAQHRWESNSKRCWKQYYDCRLDHYSTLASIMKRETWTFIAWLRRLQQFKDITAVKSILWILRFCFALWIFFYICFPPTMTGKHKCTTIDLSVELETGIKFQLEMQSQLLSDRRVAAGLGCELWSSFIALVLSIPLHSKLP